MIGSPENNFNTMQGQQPRNQMLGNALRNPSATQNYRQPNMLSPNQYGSPTPQMSNMQMPQSNAGYNLQPMIPNMNQASQGPIGMNQQGQNRFGVGLARPMPQQTQVS
jgi:hypothetical protein